MEIKITATGPTGSGKTTLLKLLQGLLHRHSNFHVIRYDHRCGSEHFIVSRTPVAFPEEKGEIT